MATKKTETPNDRTPEPGDVTGEETEPQAFVDPAGDEDEYHGIPGQIEYPDRSVDAERAAAFAAGKVDSLDPDDEDGDRDGWQNPADRPATNVDEDTDTSTNPNASRSSRSSTSRKSDE